jgi:hypothetical protein
VRGVEGGAVPAKALEQAIVDACMLCVINRRVQLEQPTAETEAVVPSEVR